MTIARRCAGNGAHRGRHLQIGIGFKSMIRSPDLAWPFSGKNCEISMNASIGSLAFVAWTTAVAVSDLRHRRVANALVIAGFIAAFGCAFTMRSPFGVAPAHAALGALAGLISLLPFFALRVMGAADVKVFAVLGSWCGPLALVDLWVMAGILGGLHALVLLMRRRVRLIRPARCSATAPWMRGHGATPYVTCLAIPALGMFVLRQSGWV